MLIVEIDEMFASKEVIPEGMIDANLAKVRELAAMAETDDYFKAKYQFAIQRSPDAAGLHSQLKMLLVNN